MAAPLRSGATALCPSRYAIVRLPADEAILRAAVVAVLKERSG